MTPDDFSTADERTAYYSRQFNARAAVPEHQEIFARWAHDSAQVRRAQAGLLDLAYGDAGGERLDFFPAERKGMPLLVFIHGGWWRSLDKSDFSFVVPGYHRAGLNVAVTNYTLAPRAALEEIVHQQLRALAWLYRNAEKYGFDRERIVVAGHSAGGHLSAMMLAARWPEVGDDLPADLVKGGVLMSGLFDLEAVRHADFLNADLKLEADDAARLSPALMPQGHPTPFLTAVGGMESEEFHRQNELIIAHWKSAHVVDIPLPGFHHFTICDAFAQPGNALFEDTLLLFDRS